MERIPGEAPRKPEANEARDHYREYIAPMLEMLSSMEKTSPDAFERWGGKDEWWHLEELPLIGNDGEKSALEQALRVLGEMNSLASMQERPGDWTERFDAKSTEFFETMYGKFERLPGSK